VRVFVPGAAVVFDFDPDVVTGDAGPDGEGAAGVAAGRVQHGVGSQLGDAEHGVAGRRAGREDGGDERAGYLYLIAVGGQHLLAHRRG
jgi:hypothetical protein